MTDRTLDRVPSKPDPRRSAFALEMTEPPRSYTWSLPFVLDQGREGACVAHAATHEAVARPVQVRFSQRDLPLWAPRAQAARGRGHGDAAVAQAFAFDAYDWCRRNDEWEGEAYDGTSVAAGAKAMALAGVWGEYRWTRNAVTLAAAVSRKGPAVIGVDWYGGFFRPDTEGFLNPTGHVEGGHAIVINGYSLTRRAFVATNSWGPGWGRRGRAYIRDEVMAQLLSQGGEACFPVTRRP